MRKTLLGVNILLIALTPVILIATASGFNSQMDAAYASGQNDGEHEQNGLVYNGNTVSNIFAYDAQGHALKQVQLYDQSGKPLYTVSDPNQAIAGDRNFVPYASELGRGGWNVYPLSTVSPDQLGADGYPRKNAHLTPSSLHDLLVSPLKKSATPSPTATPTATPTPTPTPTPTN